MTQQTPQPEQYFVAVPVSSGELPILEDSEIGRYFMTMFKDRGDYLCNTWFDKASNSFGTFPVTHWLKPISILERDKEVAGKAFQAGMDHGIDICKSTEWAEDTTTPNKDQYLQSLNS